MLKQFLNRLSGRRAQADDLNSVLREQLNRRSQLNADIDRIRAEMDAAVLAGTSLSGMDEQVNHERYQRLSRQLNARQRDADRLGSAIARMEFLQDVRSETQFVDQLEHLTSLCGDPEALERQQDWIDIRSENLSKQNRRLEEIRARRDAPMDAPSAQDDEYSRRVAALRGAEAATSIENA